MKFKNVLINLAERRKKLKIEKNLIERELFEIQKRIELICEHNEITLMGGYLIKDEDDYYTQCVEKWIFCRICRIEWHEKKEGIKTLKKIKKDADKVNGEWKIK